MRPIRCMGLAALLTASLQPAAAGEVTVLTPAEAALDRLRWEARPVIVFADGAEDPRLAEQMARFRAGADSLGARDIVVILDTGTSMLRPAFDPQGFTVVLIGKDGGEKGRWTRPVPIATLETLIDAMPMRRREMRERGQTPD